MNLTNFIFWLLHIHNHPTLSILIPLHSPYTPFVDYKNTFSDYIDFFANCAHNSDDYANTPNDLANIVGDSINTPDISSINFWSQILHYYNYCLLQIENKYFVHHWIYDLLFIFIIFHLWFLYLTSFIILLCFKIHLLNSTYTLFPIYWHMLFFFSNFRFHIVIRF